MASFSTGGIGLSCHMGATFSKKVRNLEHQKNEFLRETGLEKRSRRENSAVRCGISLRFILASKKNQHQINDFFKNN